MLSLFEFPMLPAISRMGLSFGVDSGVATAAMLLNTITTAAVTLDTSFMEFPPINPELPDTIFIRRSQLVQTA
jgi:hypothetical protein